MKEPNFISKSKEVQAIIKGLTLSKSLMVSSLITGEAHTGKRTLVNSIFPKSISVDANEIEKLEKMLEEHSELIIYNFEAIKNIQSLKIENRRIIAIANYSKISKSAKNHFAFIYTMPPLRKRPKDIEFFLENCSKDLREYLTIENEIKIEVDQLDLSENFKSMKRSLYKLLVKKTLSKEDIEEILFDYLYEQIEGKNSYRELLPLFEKPLITAGLQKFKSQLKLSYVLGLNRNTLRKKINENDIN